MTRFSTRFSKPLRWLAFLATAAGVWLLYFAWRPPMPMLFMKHVAHMNDAPQVSLTFDDAPHPVTTPLLLAALKRAGVPASFFVVGEGTRFYPELSRRIVADGHALANHSDWHRNLTRVEPHEIGAEVEPCFAEIARLGEGQRWQHTRLFRPPGGGLDRKTMRYLYERDHTLAWWSLNTGDWTCPPGWKILNSAKEMRAGDVLLLHDGGLGTPQAVPAIVRAARKQGLECVVMPE